MNILTDPDVAYLKLEYAVRLRIYWEIGNFCPYKCSYCSDGSNIGDKPYQSKDNILDIMNQLPESFITFSGGEPTYHPDIEYILSNKPKHIRICVVSNGTRPLGFWERIVPDINTVVLTFHAEHAETDRFFNTAKFIFIDSKKMGRVNVPMIPEYWDKCLEMVYLCKEAGIPVVAKQLLDSFGSTSTKYIVRYTQKHIEWILEQNKDMEKSVLKINVYDKYNNIIHFTNPAELLAKKQTNFNGWRCYVPRQYLLISNKGDIYNTNCGQKEKVGTIYTGITFPTKSVICEQTFCWNFDDIAGTKSSPNFNEPVS